MLEALTSAGLKTEMLTDLGHDELLTPDFEKITPEAVVSYAMGFTQGGRFKARLCTLATPCTLENFIAMTGGKPAEYKGDDKFRQHDISYGSNKYLITYRQFSPQEYLVCEDQGGTAPAEPGKALAAVRNAVAGSGRLFWTSARTMRLPGTFFNAQSTDAYALTNLEISIQWQDDLVFRAEASLGSPGAATALTAAARGKLPPMPAIPGGAGKGAAPRQELTATEARACYQLTVPKATTGAALPALLEGMMHGEYRERARRDSRSVIFTWSAAVAADYPGTDGVTDVMQLLDRLHKGLSNPSATPGAAAWREHISETPAYRRLLASWLKLEKGKLTLSPLGQKEWDDYEKETAKVPATDPAAIAKARRNAQNLSACFLGAAAAGATSVTGASSAREAVDALVQGTMGQSVFAGHRFQVLLTKAETERALDYLVWENGKLKYDGPQ